LISGDVKMQGQIVRDGFRTCLMVFWIVAGVVAGVVTGGDEVYHHSSTRVIAGGVRAHLNARGTLVTLCWGKKPYLSMAGVVGVRQLGPCARVWLPPSGQRRTDVFHGASRKTHGGGALGRILFITAESHSLGGGRQHRGKWMWTWPRPPPCRTSPLESRAIPATEWGCDGDEERGTQRRG
jgi:hypothetical protein